MGKSTLARAVYKELLPQFTKGHAAIILMEDATEKSTGKALSELVVQLGSKGTNSVHLQLCLRRKSKPVLLLLDNLWTSDQVNRLLLKQDIPDGSKVLVTTRERKCVGGCAQNSPEMYTMPEMSTPAARDLIQRVMRSEQIEDDKVCQCYCCTESSARVLCSEVTSSQITLRS
jgi:NB-ARC domain